MYKWNEQEHKRYARRCDRFLDSWIQEGVTPCLSVGLLHKNQLVYTYTKGLSQDGGEPVGAGTRFNIGSVSKTLTGALLLKLVESGRISLNDKVKRYIPEYKHPEVTLFQLLTHSAGYTDDYGITFPRFHEFEDYMTRVYGMAPNQPPGSSSVYFTYGYALLMDVLQRVSGMTIEQFGRLHLFDPLGMDDTTYDHGSLEEGSYVLPCKADENRWDRNLDRLATTADSSVYSTAADLLKFCSMILNRGVWDGKRIFAEATSDLMLRESTGGRFAKTPVFWIKTDMDTYGCFGDLNSPSTVGHPGFSGCMMFIDPFYQKAGAIVTNSQKLHSDFHNYTKIINLLLADTGAGIS